MKKFFLGFGLGVVVLAIVMLARAHWLFPDTQIDVVQLTPNLNVDQSDAIARFAKSIQFQTISYDDPKKLDNEAFTGIRAHIQQSFPLIHQFAKHQVFNQHSLLYEFTGSDSSSKPALFMGHLDVVPVDEVTQDQWQQPPFSGAVVDDIVWGRGTIDDKVTVFALLESMEAMLKEGVQLKRTVYFAFGHDEEIGGKQGAKKIAEHFKQQGIQFEFVLDEGGAITEGIVKGVEHPVAMIGIAEKGFVNIQLTVNSDGGHSSQPPNQTALGILSQAIVNLENNQFETDFSYSQKTFKKIGYYAPLSARIPLANMWLLEPVVKNVMLSSPTTAASIRSTIAATMASGSSKSNILPTQASAVVNIRIFPGESVASVKQHVINAIDDTRVEVDTFMENEPSAVSPTDSLGFNLIEKHIRQLDNEVLVAPYLVVGGTDSKHFYGLSDNIYRFMMVRLDQQGLKRFHGVNEQLPVKDYMNAIAFFHGLLMETAAQ
ncbi:MAG: M20 family peptidase [Aliiglaciecola sp.]